MAAAPLPLALTILLLRYKNQFENTGGLAINSPAGMGHPSFKLTDLSLMREFFKLVGVRKYEIQPGENITVKRFRNKPRSIDESKFYDANNSALLTHCLPGQSIHLWRITGTPQSGDDSKAANYSKLCSGTPQSASAGSTATLCDVKMAFVFSYHYRVSSYSNSDYSSFLPTALPSGLTVTNIYPGTSTAAAAAPVP